MIDVSTAHWDRNDRSLPFALSTSRQRGGWDYPAHYHANFFEIVCVHEGHFQQEINGRHFDHPPRTLCLIREPDVHKLWGEGFVMTNIMIGNWWVTQFEKLWGTDEIRTRLLKTPEPPVAQLSAPAWRAFAQQIREQQTQLPAAARMARFSQFLMNILLDHFLEAHTFGEQEEGLPEWLDAVVRWVAAHADRPIRVEDIVERASRCPEHVSRSFRKHLGMTPSQYLNRMRLERAIDLLRTTHMSVLDICYSAGFDNPSYFHRVFRNAHGITPSAFRKRYSIFRRAKDGVQ